MMKRWKWKKELIKRCKYCNNEFIAHTQQKIYCSKECYQECYHKVYNEKNYVAKKRLIICVVCGKKKETGFSHTRYCSEKCQKDYFREKYKNKACNPVYNPWTSLRYAILRRDGFRCRYCGRSPLDDMTVKLHCDHILPKKRGGKDKISNLVTACDLCNIGKSDVLLEARQIEKIKNRSIV